MRIFTYIVLLAVILLGVSFATLNSGAVNFNYYIGHRAFPLSLLLVLTFSTGCILGLLAGLFLLIKSKIKNHRLQSQLKVAEKEITNLRTIPLQDRH